MAGEKRRLPVLQNTDDPDEPPRPAWQWILFDVLVTLAVLVGLAAPATFLRQKMLSGEVAPPTDLKFLVLLSLPHLIALIVSTGFGGFLLGRYGGKSASVREAAIGAGILCAFEVLIAGFAVPALPLVLVVVTMTSATLSAMYGRKKR